MQLNLTYKIKSVKYVHNAYEATFIDLTDNSEHTEGIPLVLLLNPTPNRITAFIENYIDGRVRQLTLYRN